MTVNRRVRLLDAVRRRAGPRGGMITTMGAADIAASQRSHLGHGLVQDAMFGPIADGVEVSDSSFTARCGELGVRHYVPASRTPRGTVINFHGGGWVLGDLDYTDWPCSTVAARTGAHVVSIDYRLAPQHRYPAATEDCLDALRWAAELDASAGGIVLMGDSAGGNLAAVTARQARDASIAVALQVLIYPATDLGLESPSLDIDLRTSILDRASVNAFRGHYLGPNADALALEPNASPLLAQDLSGLAPALIITAEHDPLRDDGRRYAEALRAVGVPVRETDYLDAPHGFMALPGLVPAAKQALSEVCAEVSRAFA